MLSKFMLCCGVAASVLYIAMNVFIPLQWEAYSSASQTISELSAIGAPTRELWVSVGYLYTLLTATFGAGVVLSGSESRRLRIAGGLLVITAVFGNFWPPMHLRGAHFALTDALHIAWAVGTLVLMLAVMLLASAELGKRFRFYTWATIAVWLVFGTLTGIDGPRIASNLPTPFIGVWERINVGAYMLWIMVFAVVLLRRRVGDTPVRRGIRPAATAV